MTQDKSLIFDLDGTLYPFAPGKNLTFSQTKFYADLCRRIEKFVANYFNVSSRAAAKILADIDIAFNGELSIGFEQVYGIDRHLYFEATWACEPYQYIQADKKLKREMAAFRGHSLLLTAAPRSWATKARQYLDVAHIFGEHVITGDIDLRKPNPKIFLEAAARLDVQPYTVISVGDQNESDILPAKSLGMKTIIIGPDKKDADHKAADIYEALTIVKERLL